jgi:acyl-CoA dehydrogenase
MPDRSFLHLPFFDESHRELAGALDDWAAEHVPRLITGELDSSARALVRAYGQVGWLRHAVPTDNGSLDVRSFCICRETLARHDSLADFSFAMQGLGSGPITLFGSEKLKERYLSRVARGDAVAAFAISESNAGSDIAAMRTTARRDGGSFVVDGEKTWISNAGIADFYVVFCKLEGEERSHIALVVDADNPGLTVSERIDLAAPHPFGTVTFTGCRVAADSVVGEVGKGLRIALGTLDVFRASVGAAALGFARRALDEAIAHVTTRSAFGQRLSDLQITQSKLAMMATEVDASAQLVYRAAWARDTGAARVTREASMAKMYSTEAAQRVVDSAVQLLGARGVIRGSVVEALYRDVRALRIYEGTTEIQQLVIASQILRNTRDGRE